MFKVSRILLLAPAATPLNAILSEAGYDVVCIESQIDESYIKSGNFDFLISYGYRHIISAEKLAYFQPARAVNLHISYLPYNRGADPNFWSLYEDTPRGVSIHYMDAGIDTGDIIAQTEVAFDERIDTLATSYRKLQEAMVQLFLVNYKNILSGKSNASKQRHTGTYHNARDKETLFSTLGNDPWNTPIEKIIAMGRRDRKA